MKLLATMCGVLLLFVGVHARRCERRLPGTGRVGGRCVGGGAEGGN